VDKHISGCVMHNSVGIFKAIHKCFILSVYICSTIGKHTLACSRHEVVFLLQFSTGQRCLLVYLLHSTGISRAYGCHCDPSVRHLIIHKRYLTWSENCTHTPLRKIFKWSRLFTLFQAKNTPKVLLQLKAMLCSAA